ncbi:MAG: hypothetical protein ACE5H8_10500 [Alphaproteobacteria bacterium]
MYVPEHFSETDPGALAALMRAAGDAGSQALADLMARREDD